MLLRSPRRKTDEGASLFGGFSAFEEPQQADMVMGLQTALSRELTPFENEMVRQKLP